VSAHRSYRWVYKQNYKPWRIAEYLILNQAMPRSLRSSYDEIVDALEHLANLYGDRFPCHETAAATRQTLAQGDINRIFQSGLHEFLEDFIFRNNRLGSEIAEAYHFNA
jgi:uncharacterized alpha-E superfamily protein